MRYKFSGGGYGGGVARVILDDAREDVELLSTS